MKIFFDKKISYTEIAAGLFLIVWVVLAISPKYRYDWVLENLIVLFSVPWLWKLYHKKWLSDLSWVMVFCFMSLHLIGAHYTYSETPAGFEISSWFGAERNHYDRIIHFVFGLMLGVPVTELIAGFNIMNQKWAVRFLPCIFASAGTAYELLEWITAILVAPEAGTAFLGTQGDPWDAQKDLALNVGGAFLLTLILSLKTDRNHQGS